MNLLRQSFLYACIFISQLAISQQKKFTIVAFGDMPYRVPNDYPKFERVIKTLNKENPDFIVHVGDFKSGSSLCSTEYFEKMHAYFETIQPPFIYTPGDNEWTDCNRKAAGEYDPNERLALLRKMFFGSDKSFGKKKINLISQAKSAGFEKFVENNMWTYGGLEFATIHLVGSNNNFKESGDNQEFIEREKANLAWLEQVFAAAQDKKGLMFFTQADMFYKDRKPSKGFEKVVDKITELTQKYGKQVFLVNGDSHRFITDKPILINNQKATLMNFTRIQVFGDAEMAAIKITYDPKSTSLFQVEQMMID
ncbi:MAG: metallophosphoesterase [Chitinophagia bacterium]|nr:metallophosphoesterase [Chitinophagia bacterium]